MSTSYTPQRILSYVIASDRGLAPNVAGGVCTLAVCKPGVRQAATIGKDWIMAVSTAAHGRNRLIYAMQADEKIAYADYFKDPRFACKKPGRDAQGDNFFKLERGVYTVAFNTAAHADNPEKIARDIKSPVVVVGHRFWYFGANAPELPASITQTNLVIPGIGRRGHRVNEDPAVIKAFTKWISAYKPGVYGPPRDAAVRPRPAR